MVHLHNSFEEMIFAWHFRSILYHIFPFLLKGYKIKTADATGKDYVSLLKKKKKDILLLEPSAGLQLKNV